VQRWQVINGCTSRVLALRLEEVLPLTQVALDGCYSAPVGVPAGVAPATGPTCSCATVGGFRWSATSGRRPRRLTAWWTVARPAGGSPWLRLRPATTPPPLPATLPAPSPARPGDGQRQLTFAMGMGGWDGSTIDRRTFTTPTAATTPSLGATETGPWSHRPMDTRSLRLALPRARGQSRAPPVKPPGRRPRPGGLGRLRIHSPTTGHSVFLPHLDRRSGMMPPSTSTAGEPGRQAGADIAATLGRSTRRRPRRLIRYRHASATRLTTPRLLDSLVPPIPATATRPLTAQAGDRRRCGRRVLAPPGEASVQPPRWRTRTCRWCWSCPHHGSPTSFAAGTSSPLITDSS
jgi:hypothetical protein